MDEFARIRYWTSKREQTHLTARNGILRSIGDDAAIVSSDSVLGETQMNPDVDWLYTVDTMVEGVHFNEQTMSYYQLGYKALASNISDIAAMGGMPLHALVAVSIPAHVSNEQIDQLYEGLYQCANQFQVAIVGGDTTAAPHSLVITITVVGQVEHGKAISREGALPGQLLVLTGATGCSAAGLHLLQNPIEAQLLNESHQNRLKQAHQLPIPHIEEGRLLQQSGACTALNDVSDGLSSEAHEIAASSSVDIVIESDHLPISEALSQYAALRQLNAYDWILNGGEDYVLLAAIDESAYVELQHQFKLAGKSIYKIGYVEQGDGTV